MSLRLNLQVGWVRVHHWLIRIGCSLLLVPSSSCGHDAAPSAPGRLVATVQSLGTVELSAEAASALGVEVAEVTLGSADRSITVGGEVIVPVGREVVLSAPTGGRVGGTAQVLPGQTVTAGQVLLSLIPMAMIDRDGRARAQRDLEAARAELVLAEARLSRANAMVQDHSASQRSQEEATAQHTVAAASVSAAESRLRTLSSGALDSDIALTIRSPVDGVIRTVNVTHGQSVPVGAPLIAIAGTGRWVRATFAASDGRYLGSLHSVHARRVGTSLQVPLTPMLSPPSADVTRGTVDLFFLLPAETTWTPGERILVDVTAAPSETETTSGASEATSTVRSVPINSVIRDPEGSAWVYEQLNEDGDDGHRSFRRRRVNPIRREGDRMLLASGVLVGARVVSVGAAEIWGFELGADR